jgi:hypothetical protein
MQLQIIFICIFLNDQHIEKFQIYVLNPILCNNIIIAPLQRTAEVTLELRIKTDTGERYFLKLFLCLIKHHAVDIKQN